MTDEPQDLKPPQPAQKQKTHSDHHEKTPQEKEEEVKQIIQWVDQIKDESTREQALDELSRKRESVSDLALYIWYSTGTVATLLQEIIYTYQLLAPPKLTIPKSNRACSVLALFQCVAAHSETRHAFLQAQIPIFLYPFLNTVNKTKPYEYIRLTALGVIGALVKVDNTEVIQFLLNTEIIPLCLRIMERGSELSKTVACFIVQRILLDDNGLKYICEKPERLYAIDSVLGYMVKNKPSARLIKHIIRSFSRLSDNPEAREILKNNIPKEMKEKSFIDQLDESSKKWLLNLMKSLNSAKTPGTSNTNSINANLQPPQININNNVVGNVNNGNNLNMGVNMMMQMNMQQAPNYMINPGVNDFGYQMYPNENYMKNMGMSFQNKGYSNLPYNYNGYQK